MQTETMQTDQEFMIADPLSDEFRKTVVEGYRRQIIREDKKAYANGYLEGRAWIACNLSYFEIDGPDVESAPLCRLDARNLMNLVRDRRIWSEDEWKSLFFPSETRKYTPAERLFFILCPQWDYDRDKAKAFWADREQWSEGDMFVGMGHDFYRGIADGMLSVWEEIKDEV